MRAKAEGREPEGMDAATAALFPTELENSTIGLLPSGWRVGRLDEIAVFQRGFDLPASSRTEGSYPVLAASGPSGTHNEFRVRGPGVTTGRSGVLGRTFYVRGDFWPLNTSLWAKEFPLSTPIYAYRALQHVDLAGFNAGSAVPTLNRNHIHSLPFLIPPVALIERFSAIAFALDNDAQIKEQQAETLGQIRDTLLPRLISGKLRIPEAEKLVEAVL